MPATAVFIVLTVFGLLDAGYLAYKHRVGQPLVCPIGEDCSVVVNSRWNNILGVRNELLGIAYYALLFATAIITVASPGIASTIGPYFKIITGLGLLFSIFLTWLQARVIKNYCFYCLLSALITLLLFVNSFFLV